jgi:adenine-specific DNA methylase
MAAYAVQGYAPKRDAAGKPNGGRFFTAYDESYARQYDSALAEWEERKDGDLRDYWPRSVIPYGFMTGIANGDIREGHGFTHWWTMFNPRQLLVHAQLLKAIVEVGNHDWRVRQTCEDQAGEAWACGRRAASELAAAVAGGEIHCISRERDRYQRLVATCWARGRDVGQSLVAHSWAVAYRRYSVDYLRDEDLARYLTQGLWGGRFEMPWEWRQPRRRQ